MATYELHEITDDYRPMPGLIGNLQRFIAALVQRYRRRDTVERLSRLDAFLLADIGIDPCDLADARDGDDEALWTKIGRRG